MPELLYLATSDAQGPTHVTSLNRTTLRQQTIAKIASRLAASVAPAAPAPLAPVHTLAAAVRAFGTLTVPVALAPPPVAAGNAPAVPAATCDASAGRPGHPATSAVPSAAPAAGPAVRAASSAALSFSSNSP